MQKNVQVKDRSLLSLSWPLFLTFGIATCQPMMDSWFLARTSETAAAGVGALGPILGAIFMAITAFSQAGASIASQFMGAERPRQAGTTQTMVLLGSLLLGIAIMFITLPLSHNIVSWMGLTGDAATYGYEFLYIVSFGFAFRSLQTTLTSLIATHGLTVWNLVGNIITIISNAIMNIIFLNGYLGFPKMGVKGVAIATMLSWLISSIVLYIILKFKIHHKIRNTDFKRSRVILPDWIRIGVPAAIEPVSFQIFQVVLTAIIVHLGITAMTARIFSANFAMLAVILSVGLSSGNQILVAHLVGAHDYDKANRRLHQSLAAGCSSGFIVALIVALCGTKLMSFYTLDPEIQRLGQICLWCDVVLQPFKAANMTITAALRASGDSKFPAIVGSTMMWTCGLGTALFLGFVLDLGLAGIWLGMAADEFYRSIVNYIRWRRGNWKTLGVV
ncbi:MATE family efflux transporter [Fibrobacter sp. UWEL]|uniref:MATE family efflux transporter n=1 Tax=Fibrobacter sp. UWEL TaxID=1896209 RepID=UPI000914178A|nr:MATE family efflux transporter [Fibrobacter sp. UWEL]SHL26232.1 putative efflux protein, MATE family [Fibrobacter sp. UWEL]